MGTHVSTVGIGTQDWVPDDACTLPTVERPLRVAEFDDLFAASLRAVEVSPLRGEAPSARLLLAGGDDLAQRVRRLAEAESSCCSFFSFTVTELESPRASGVAGGTAPRTAVALDIEVPPSRADVLRALVDRAALLVPGDSA